MKFLLDTHVWIWSQEDARRIGPRTRQLLVAPQHENHVCTISTLEVARLVNSGVISMSIALKDWVAGALRATQAQTILVSHEIAMDAYAPRRVSQGSRGSPSRRCCPLS